MIQNNFRRVNSAIMPPVVLNLIIINVIVFVSDLMMEQRMGFSLTRHFGLFNPSSEYFRFYQLFTHIFMHADLTHLLSNMFSLWLYGALLENFWGARRFIVFYLFTAVGAALLHTAVGTYEISRFGAEVALFVQHPTINDFIALVNKDAYVAANEGVISLIEQWKLQPGNPLIINETREIAETLLVRKINIPTVGASGAVFGLILGAALLFPNTIRFPLFIPLKYIAIIHGLEELMYGFANNPSDNVAHFAHLGGMLFGYILIKYWNKRNRHTFY